MSYSASSLTTGNVYQFRVEARNAYGFSAFSTEVAVLAASPPSTPTAPTTAISGANIVISWQEPAANGATIESYKIYFR